MLFSKFKKPKWQHRKAEIRKEALLALSANDAEYNNIVLELINDDEADIRKLAVKRLNDIDKLENLLANENDCVVKEVAKDRFMQMISGTIESGLTVDARINKAASFENINDIESILKKTNDTAIKKALLPRINRTSILEAMVVENGSIELQLAALDKISEQAALERIIKKCRTKNKKVTQAAKQKLEQIIAEQEKPKEIEKIRKNICLSLETIKQQGYSEKFNAEFQRLSQQWQEIDFPIEKDLQQRYSQANNSCNEILQAHKEIEEKRQAELKLHAQYRIDKTNIITQLKGALEKLQEEQSAELKGDILTETDASWKEAGQLPTVEEDKFANDFYAVRKQIAKFLGAFKNAAENAPKAEELIQQINACLKEKFIPAGKFKSVERKAKSLKVDPIITNPPQPLVDICETFKKLESAFDKQEKNIENQRKEFPSILDLFEKELEAGAIKAANNLHKKARKILKNTPSINSSLKSHFNTLSANLSQLQDWKGWATTPKKEELCQEMEELAESNTASDPENLAANIKLLQDKWKKLGASEQNSSQELWERFSAAADKAFAPCKIYYADQANKRNQNQEARESVCTAMEQFYSSFDWSNPDWKAVDSYLSSQIDAWKKCGPTDRKIAKILSERHQIALDNIKSKLNDNRNKNKEAKLDIIEKAKTLLGYDDVFQAIESIKLTQKEWKEIGSTFRKDEQKLWNEFRSVCDQIFAKRQEAYDAKDSERIENLNKKNQLTEEIEKIAASNDEEFATTKQEIDELKEQWKAINNIPKSQEKPSQEKFNKACKAVIDKEDSIKDAASKHKDEAFTHKYNLCIDFESKLLASDELDHEALQVQWQEAKPTHKQLDNLLNKRFKENLALATDSDSAKAREISSQNIEQGKLICIKTEITAGIETPAEFTAQRREYQVNNLANEMKKSTPNPLAEIATLEKELLSLCLIPKDNYLAMKQRVVTAKDSLK